MKNLCKVIAVFVSVLVFSSASFAGNRVALIIGNGAYSEVGQLVNPPNDARLMANTLRDLGFEVIEEINSTQKEMKRAVRDFGKSLRNGGKETVGLFYYAGHGVQVNGTNYIIPVDAQIEQEGDVDLEAIDANSVLSMMEHSGAGLNFVILDACRNNPYTRGFRSGTRGLAKMNAPTGSFIAYATSPGDVAADGDGENSPYTIALSTAMRKPGVSVERMFRNVRNSVRQYTNNDQTPWESSSLVGGDFFFNTVAAETAETPAKGGETSQNLNAQTGPSEEKQFWDEVKDSTNPAMLEAYLTQYPTGTFAPIAKIKIASLVPTEQKPEPEPEPVRAPRQEFTITETDETLVVVKTANVRDKPSTTGNKIGLITARKIVSVTGKTTVDGASWYRVALNKGRFGYVYGALLAEISAVKAEKTKTKAKKLPKKPSKGVSEFRTGKYKTRVNAATGECKRIKIYDVVADKHKISGRWQHPEVGGAIQASIKNKNISIRMTGRTIYNIKGNAYVKGKSLVFGIKLYYDGGNCSFSFKLDNVVKK